MAYLGTSINNSPVISAKAGAPIADARGIGLKFDATGGVVVANAEGDAVIGVGIMTSNTPIAKGDDVDIQVKDIGLVVSGAAVKAGDELMVNASGKFIPATTTKRISAIALEAATGADNFIRAMIVKSYKA